MHTRGLIAFQLFFTVLLSAGSAYAQPILAPELGPATPVIPHPSAPGLVERFTGGLPTWEDPGRLLRIIAEYDGNRITVQSVTPGVGSARSYLSEHSNLVAVIIDSTGSALKTFRLPDPREVRVRELPGHVPIESQSVSSPDNRSKETTIRVDRAQFELFIPHMPNAKSLEFHESTAIGQLLGKVDLTAFSGAGLVVGIKTATDVAAGGTHTCAHLANGTVECWGRNSERQLGNGTTTNSLVPAPVSGITTATAITSGGYHSCAQLQDSTLRCWGHNNEGQIGNISPPELTLGQVNGIKASVVVTGGHHSCALLEDGSVQCWGYNLFGQLGNGKTNNSASPVVVTGLTAATTIAAGAGHNCARLVNKTVKCWGYNNEGQLGNTLAPTSEEPILVPGIQTATWVSAGARHSCARLEDGTVQCWGRNTEGQLGNGNTDNSASPVVVTGMTSATRVAAGEFHTCALMADKTVQCWGRNTEGQLGDGTTTNSSVPVPVFGITTATAVTTGGHHSCARLENGTLFCWGDNRSGQLGTTW